MADKVAFLALTSSSFNKEGLMSRFFCKDHLDKYNLYIHNKFDIHNKYFQQFEIPSEYKVNTEWGKYSLVIATIRLLMYALRDPENQRFVLISESHCPLYNIEQTCSLIFKQYPILSFSNQPKEQVWALNRFKSLIIANSRHPFSEENAKFVSQWFICNRQDAEFFTKHEIKFRKYFHTNKLCFPDELYFYLMANHFNIPIQYKNNCHFNWNLKTNQSLVDVGHRLKPKTYLKIKNRAIDTFREKSDCIFIRKVYSGTVIDEDYLLQSNDCKTNY